MSEQHSCSVYFRLVVSVSDDGRGDQTNVDPFGTGGGTGKSGNHGFGIGLANVRDRLEARFGSEASIASGPTENGYLTELRLPLVIHG